MKKIIFAVGILFCIIFSSCERKSCWECTTTATANIMGSTGQSTVKQVHCGLTESEIRDVERVGTTFTTANGYTSHTTTKCVRN